MGFAFGGSSIKKDKTIKKIVNKQEKEKKKKVVKKSSMTAKERAQQMARDRIAAKKAGTYKKPKTAQELAKARIGKGTAKKPDKTIAQVKAANKASMLKTAKDRNDAFKKAKKNKSSLKKNFTVNRRGRKVYK